MHVHYVTMRYNEGVNMNKHYYWALFPGILFLVIIPILIASGCSPAGVRVAEEVVEDVAAEELKRG